MIRVAPTALLLTAAAVVAPAHTHAQQNMADVEIDVQEVRPGVYMLVGQGGNIGLSVGDDGAFVIDDQFAPLTDKILAAIATVSDESVRFVLNTHWHGDHTGGNENMGEAGALIVAHDNVRARMSVEQVLDRFGQVSTTAASPEGALPVVTFDRTVNFHVNGGALHVFHVPRAHTDGDVIVHFRDQDVVHMGDTYFNGRYPFIDVASGGTIDGAILAMDQVLAVSTPDTRIIPGHGALSNAAELRRSRDMLQTVRNRVAQAKAAGRSVDEVLGMSPAASFQETFSGNPEGFIRAVYATIP